MILAGLAAAVGGWRLFGPVGGIVSGVGALAAPELALAPLGVWLVSGGRARQALGSLLLCPSWLAGVALLAMRRQRFSPWVLVAPAIYAAATWPWEPAVPGSLAGFLGLGPRAWGAPVLLLGLAGWRTDRRAFWTLLAASALALGPTLRPWDAPLVHNGRMLPLPGMLLPFLPEVSYIAWLATAAVIGRWRWWAALLTLPALIPREATLPSEIVEGRSWRLPELEEALGRNVEVDPEKYPELAWLMSAPHPWPDVTLAPLDQEVFSPDLPEVPRPIEAWDGIDPDLAPFFDLTMLPDAMVQVSLWTSSDAVTWTRKGVFAHSVGSLGLTVVGEDEALILSGTPSKPIEISRRMRHLHSSSVMALTTPDLERWGARQWFLNRRLAVIDPHVDWDENGLSVTGWIRTGPMSVDPVSLAGGHPVFRGREKDGWIDVPPPVYTAPGLADPMFVGEVLFSTIFPPGAVRVGDVDLPGLTVPFAWKEDGILHLIAHRFDGAAGQVVVHSTSLDGAIWDPPAVYEGVGPRCESPVQARFRGQHVLFCSERLKDPVTAG